MNDNIYSQDIVDFDIWYFRGRLAKARAEGQHELAAKLTKQIELLEDCVILSRIAITPELRVSFIDINQPDNQ